MVLYMKVNIKMGKKTELENSIGPMDQNIPGNLMIIIFMEKDYINGLIKEFMKETGSLIKWMVKENLLGLMEGNIMVNIS
jgi:hypothetical protein